LFNTLPARSNYGELLYKTVAKKVFEIGLNYTNTEKNYYLSFGLLEEDKNQNTSKKKSIAMENYKRLISYKNFFGA
jgi:hypothetical protein